MPGKTKKRRLKKDRQLMHEITGVLIIAFSVLLAVSMYAGLGSTVPKALSDFFFGLFGVVGYIVPILLMVVGILIIAAQKKKKNRLKMVLLIVGIYCLLSFIHMLSIQQINTADGYIEYLKSSYLVGMESRVGGGVVSSLVVYPAYRYLGVVASNIIFITGMVLSIIVLTNLSLKKVGEDIGGKIKNSYTGYMENRQVKLEEKMRRKEEKAQLEQEQYLEDVPEEFGEEELVQDQPDGYWEEPPEYQPVFEMQPEESFDFTIEEQPEMQEEEGWQEQELAKREFAEQERNRLFIENIQNVDKFNQKLTKQESYGEVRMNPIVDEEKEDIDLTHEMTWEELGFPFPPHGQAGEDLEPWEQELPVDLDEDYQNSQAPPYGGENDGSEEQTVTADMSGKIRPFAARQASGQDGEGGRQAVEEPHQVEYVKPPMTLLQLPKSYQKNTGYKQDSLKKARLLENTLRSFNIKANVVNVSRGPVVTRYEVQPAPGVKVSKIVNLSDDIALNMAAKGIRIEAPIPGKAAIGIEVPNEDVQSVYIKEIVDTDEFKNMGKPLAFALGKDIAGNKIYADIAKMPHLLIAGATGSGKSVCINSLIISILMNATPDEVQMIMVDPKVVELSVFNDIPHLKIPVVTNPKKAAGALNWAVNEMTDRYKAFAKRGAKDIARYNQILQEEGEKPLPKLLIIIDELADLMMVAQGDVEDAICRIAQLGRASGIHLVIATQRPSVNVITGIIKANIPSRIAFAVSSGVDSRTILDMSGAEKLLGQGDMLYYPAGAAKPLRVQGCFVSDKEVDAVTGFLKEQNIVNYDDTVTAHIEKSTDNEYGDEEEEMDPLFKEAVKLVLEYEQASTSMLQRRLRVGYARAARLIDDMYMRNIVGEAQGSKPREVLISWQDFYDLFGEQKTDEPF